MERDSRGRVVANIANADGMKTCSICNKSVHASIFRKDKDRHDGLSSKCKPCANAWHREYRRLNPGLREKYSPSVKNPRASHLKAAYRISEQQYSDMLIAQGGHCAVCQRKRPGGRGSFHVDHDHVSGKVRGLLCARCNMGIGQLGDSIEGLRAAISYLERHTK